MWSAWGRGAAAGRTIAVLAAIAFAMPGASDGARARGDSLRASIVSASQRGVLERRRIQVKVAAPAGTPVRLYATAKRRGRQAVAITQVTDLRLGRGRRVAALRLNRAGVRELKGCSPRRLTVYAAPVAHAAGGPGRRIKASRALKLDPKRCRGGGGGSGSGGGSGTGAGGGPGGGGSGGGGSGGGRPREQPPVDFATPSDSDRCDFLDQSVCLYPWPNDYFTKPDSASDTGRRLNLDIQSTPRNVEGKPIDPTDWNRGDGFSPGNEIVTKVPGLDSKAALDRSGVVQITDMGRAFDADQPVVLINARTRARHLAWAEVDANPSDPADRVLIIRPGENLEEGGRYIVALRNLRTAEGDPIAANPEFRLYRDGIVTTNPAVERRRAHFEEIFATLAAAGIERDDLYRAWDFTVASERGLTRRMLSIRDDAFGQLGDTNLADLTVQGSSPQFEVESVRSFTPAQNRNVARIVDGHMTVPCYLSLPACVPGSRFVIDPTKPDGTPQRIPGNVMQSKFRCIVPHAAAGAPARPSLYGHGLLGSRNEVTQGQLQDMANEHDFVFCATEWIGMSCPDIPTSPHDFQKIFTDALEGRTPNTLDCDIPSVATILTDVSSFPALADRVQQGMLNFLYLGRAMIHPDGFAADPAFQLDGHSVLDTTRLFYDGNSQGGIIGGALAAVAPDYDRAALGVLGMNYSTLLQRSVDFGTGQAPHPDPSDPESVVPEYAYPLYQSYPKEIERQLVISMMQLLWDRAEANGYAHHMTTDPLPNTPPHQVLLQGALGDHQVAQITAETEARTIGAYTRTQYTDPGRDLDVEPAFGIPRFPVFPFAGSALILWDSGPPRVDSEGNARGTSPPPPANVPPNGAEEDPHELPRRSPAAREQKSAFLRVGGQVIEVCGDRPCYAGGWTGP